MSTVEPMYKTILPKSEPTELQGLDVLSCDVISRLNIDKINLLPKRTSAQLLPYLAEMFGVKIEHLSSEEQRELIDISNDIYKYIGTPYAVKRALKVVGKEAELIEWFNHADLCPYTFAIKTQKLDQRGATFLIDLINEFKNERSWLKQIGDGSCMGVLKLDVSSLDASVIEGIEGVDILDVKVCFKSLRTTALSISEPTVLRNYKRFRVHEMLFNIPTILKIVEKTKNRGYRLERRWTGTWGKSTWESNEHTEIVGRFKNKQKNKQARPNSYWESDWTGRSWTESYRKSKKLYLYKALNIELNLSFSKEKKQVRGLTLKRSWLGAWNDGTWDDRYTIQGEKNVNI